MDGWMDEWGQCLGHACVQTSTCQHTRIHTLSLTCHHQSSQRREEGEFGAALVGKKVRVYRPEQLRYLEVRVG